MIFNMNNPTSKALVLYTLKGGLIIYDESRSKSPLLNSKKNKHKNLKTFLSIYGPILNISIFISGTDSHLLLNFKDTSGIYMWFNLTNGKFYVGSAKCLYERLRSYYKKGELNSNRIISKSLLKYGYGNFIIIILYIFPYFDNKLLLNKEQYYIDYLNPLYNIAKIAGNTAGVKASVETRLKISKKLLGNKYALGYKHTDEIKLKLSNIHKGKIFSEEYRLNLSNSQLGNNKVYVYNDKNILIDTFDSVKNCHTP